MHCLLIHQMFALPSEGGGTRHFEFARHCVEQGEQFTVITSDVSYLHGNRSSQPREEHIDGVHVCRVAMSTVLHKNFFWRLVAYFGFMQRSFVAGWQQGKHADIIMGTSPSLFQAFAASMVALLRRKPFLLEIRDLWPDFAIDMGILKSRVAIFLSRRLESYLYYHACHIVVNSPAYVEYLVNRGIDKEKISLISNGVDPDMFGPSLDGAAYKKQHHLEGKFIAVYAGAIGPANDIQTIIRAANILNDDPDIHFVIAGDGKARKEIDQLIEQLQLTNITMPGVIPKTEIAEFLAVADLCLATLMDIRMFKTTFPNKVFDYMAAGRPTILGIDGVIREVIEQSGGGVFVRPGDPQQLAQAIRELKDNPELCQEMGNRARQFVVQHFNRKDQAHAFHALIANILNSGNEVQATVQG